jgi:hypothetical protein
MGGTAIENTKEALVTACVGLRACVCVRVYATNYHAFI